jgi:phosphopantothenoylcysteine decarboxylase/phosphopantothenate--cysteine ligase
MSTTLTIRNLDEAVKQRLRVRAAQHGRSMEAEARDILSRDVMKTASDASAPVLAKGKFDHLVGIWKGGMSTDDLMKELRGED